MKLTQEELKNLFDYKDGKLFWKNPRSHRSKVGQEAGTIRRDGYLQINLKEGKYVAHRIIFLMHHGYLPKYIDHLDKNPLNNKIENLRECSHSQNMQNTGIKKTNTSGIKNVSWDKIKQKWNVRLMFKGIQKNIGYFNDIELAELVAIEAKEKYHKEFARCR